MDINYIIIGRCIAMGLTLTVYKNARQSLQQLLIIYN